MITKDEAIKVVNKKLKEYEKSEGYDLVILDEYTIETKTFWVFHYQSVDTDLAGNAPFIVDKEYGNLYITGTGEDIKFYLKAFKKLYRKFRNSPKEIQKSMPI